MAAELKTKENEANVKAFLDTIADEQKQKDAYAVMELMAEASGYEPKMWGGSIIGYGTYHYKYESGHEGDMCMVGFSPRKTALTLYVQGVLVKHPDVVSTLGKYKTGKGCIYINKLQDVNTEVLKQLVKLSMQHTRETYPDPA